VPSQQNFFAVIKTNDDIEIKRIRVNQSLQNELIQIFEDQRIKFEEGVDTEVEFNGDWKPDDNEVLTLENISEASILVSAINANASSFNDLQVSNFTNEPIKAIFTGIKTGNITKVFLQKFSSRQALSLSQLPIIKMQTGNTFVKSTGDIFTIDNRLVAIIENTKTKFKSFHNLRMVFDLSNFYQEATNEDLKAFSQHDSLEVNDADLLIGQADTTIRKMVHSIIRTDVLGSYTVNDIAEASRDFPGIEININNGKLVLPDDKKELKDILHFLLEDIYKGALSGSSYLTNSKRTL